MSLPPQFAPPIVSELPGLPPVSPDQAVALLRSAAVQMHYQPILDLRTGRTMKVEALARLMDNGRVLYPGSFLPHFDAEDLLELYIIGLDQSLQEQRNWRDGGKEIELSVNIPPGALDDPRYYEATIKALARHACAPQMLTLEILETEGLASTDEALEQFRRYRGLGVHMAQDDLGCGHSSLVRLRQLPFDYIKIDRNIVSMDADDDIDALHFVYQLTRLGHALGKTVVVEGVDSAGLIEAIGILGADGAQGYAVARPMSARHLAEWMENRPEPVAGSRPDTAPGKIARLLVAEERLLAGGQDFPIIDLPCTSVTPHSPRTCKARACRACRLARFRDEVGSIFGGELGAVPELNALLRVATRLGVCSQAYRAARRQLAAAV